MASVYRSGPVGTSIEMSRLNVASRVCLGALCFLLAGCGVFSVPIPADPASSGAAPPSSSRAVNSPWQSLTSTANNCDAFTVVLCPTQNEVERVNLCFPFSPSAQTDSTEGALKLIERFAQHKSSCREALRAEDLRRQYVASVQQQGDFETLSRIAALFFGAASAQQLVQHGGGAAQKNWLIGAGVAYYLPQLTVSQARQLILLGGAKSLSCSLDAARRVELSPESILYQQLIVSKLEEARETYVQKATEAIKQDTEAGCKLQTVKPKGRKTSATKEGNRLFEAAPPAGYSPSHDVNQCANRARLAYEGSSELRTYAEDLLTTAGAEFDKIDKTNEGLRAIVNGVSDEVQAESLKSQPSPAQLLAAIQGIHAGLPLTATAHAGFNEGAKRIVDSRFEEEYQALRAATKPVEREISNVRARLNKHSEVQQACFEQEARRSLAVFPNTEVIRLATGVGYTLVVQFRDSVPTPMVSGRGAEVIRLDSSVNGKELRTTVTLTDGKKAVDAEIVFSAGGHSTRPIRLQYSP